MGQIVSTAAKPKRCNKNQLSQLGVLAAGLHVLVSSDNSMNAAGQADFDCYIIGDGTTAATALELHKFKGEELEETLFGVPDENVDFSINITQGQGVLYTNTTKQCWMEAGKTYTFSVLNADALGSSEVNIYFRNEDNTADSYIRANTFSTQEKSFPIRINKNTLVEITPVNNVGYVRFYAGSSKILDTAEISFNVHWESGNSGVIPTLATKEEIANFTTKNYVDGEVAAVEQYAEGVKADVQALDEELNGLPDTSIDLQLPITAGQGITLNDYPMECELEAGKEYTFTIENASELGGSKVYIYFRNAANDADVYALINGTYSDKTVQFSDTKNTTFTVVPNDDIGIVRFYAGSSTILVTMTVEINVFRETDDRGVLPTLATYEYVNSHITTETTFDDFGRAYYWYVSPIDGTDDTSSSGTAQKLKVPNMGYSKLVATLGSIWTQYAAIVFSSGDTPSDGFISAIPFLNGTNTYETAIPSGTRNIFLFNRQGSCANPSVTFYQFVNDAVENMQDGSGVASSFDMSPDITYIAHRGVHVNSLAPDNSVDSVYFAARAGFEYTECDLRKTRDGAFVLMHASFWNNVCNKSDYSMPSSFQNDYVEFHTLSDLRQNYVLRSPNVEMRKPVPTFEEYLWACKKAGVKPYVHCLIKAKGELPSDPDPDTSLAYVDAERDVPMLWEMIKTILGSDDVYWAATYTSSFRELSDNININCEMRGYFPEETTSRAEDLMRVYGPKCHTNNNPYGDGTYFSFNNSKPLKMAGVGVGIYETGVAPNFNYLVEGGIDIIVTDYAAPSPKGKPSVFIANSDGGNYDDFTTDGTIGSDGVTLASGQSISLAKIPKELYLGGFYVAFELVGSATLQMSGCSSDYTSASSLSITGTDENKLFIYQFLTHGIVPSFKLLATAACVVKNIQVHQVEF